MIRPARADDLAALAAIEESVFGSDAWSEPQVAEELASPTHSVVVAESDDAVVGFAAISIAGDVADLTRIVVTNDARRSGVATDLLAVCEEQAGRGGAERMLLEVAAANTVAQAFYVARGYEQIARRQRYYASGDDALVFARALG